MSAQVPPSSRIEPLPTASVVRDALGTWIVLDTGEDDGQILLVPFSLRHARKVEREDFDGSFRMFQL